jgi:hypothetical protein
MSKHFNNTVASCGEGKFLDPHKLADSTITNPNCPRVLRVVVNASPIG